MGAVTTASAAAPGRDDPLGTAATGPPAGTAAADDARAQAGALLVQLFHYLEQHLEGHPGLAPAVQAMRDAVGQYVSGGGVDPLDGVRTVVATIARARAADPVLPEP